MTKLAGKTAVVAGGGKNLGGLVSRHLAGLGANVVVHYNSPSSEAEARETAAAVEAAGGKALLFQGDLTAPAKVTELFDAAVAEFGGVDVAVNTVGKVLRKPILETSEEEYDSMLDINAKAAYFFIKEAGRTLNDDGTLITIVTALLGAFTDGYSTYAGGKSPVEHFNRAAAKEFGVRGISVNAIAPGPMDTPFFYGQETPERVEFHKSQGMGNRLTFIEDIAPIVDFLSTDGHWITGQTLFANGGYTTR
ncbi:SDR family oxidoreductase [Tsukamurella tyrosinosolvens]|jgi:NAD(P)-dependent dehydrogenase (short-subunit alcohol dehydrogenase family)|uniref:NAD(P)-dependent dehydrogenase, short-chain alcohol dehydrogenase family n=1 Tax=Tsukamurella tyrosinosolvens TaxID=57704 RepID=A0A1H5AFY7_TSUTY|nr:MULTISPECIES: SDR family oxidoreductase [Tsukamurella]AUN42165.1 short chain dehydrogenase [Tsukamurella tyrosinosolvens]KXO95348.1 short-chain dehydrogenase [Tsukamurella tyrosinosolvens]KXP07428.1 short-chain dehydrogenase [Tsukamurella tyrosinosolvens]MCA0158950.1 SDR family oxidoreductase [Tsukamurella sp. M9C]MCA4994838.1 SDR family oxidoreductase [Tsukamurella tyrosinosolvens]